MSVDDSWDARKLQNMRIADLYEQVGFDAYARRMKDCASRLKFAFGQMDLEASSLSSKLVGANFCRVPQCSICQWRRCLRWKAKFDQALPVINADHPCARWIFLTLTVKNCDVGYLRTTIQEMNSGFANLIRRMAWPAIGWIRSLEVTRGLDNSAHPHFHSLLIVPLGYFGGRSYMKQSSWVAEWQAAMNLSYRPVVHVRAADKSKSFRNAVAETFKYQVKPADLAADADWLLELTCQLDHLRKTNPGGVLRRILSSLEREPDDLIGLSSQGSTKTGFFETRSWSNSRLSYEFKYEKAGQNLDFADFARQIIS